MGPASTLGEMAEWSNAAASKAVVPLVGTGGSNPSLSAEALPRSTTGRGRVAKFHSRCRKRNRQTTTSSSFQLPNNSKSGTRNTTTRLTASGCECTRKTRALSRSHARKLSISLFVLDGSTDLQDAKTTCRTFRSIHRAASEASGRKSIATTLKGSPKKAG